MPFNPGQAGGDPSQDPRFLLPGLPSAPAPVGPPKPPIPAAPGSPTLRNRVPDDPTGGTGGAPTPPGGAPAPPAPTRQPPPQWKTDLWEQYKREGRPGDWQAYWRARQPGAKPPTSQPGAPTQPPTTPTPVPGMPPLNPNVPPGQPATPGQMIPSLNLPIPDYGLPFNPMMGMMPFAGIGTVNMPGDFNDPYNAFLASIPVQERIRDEQISDAMAHAGFGGNRYSTSAMNTAGRIGADTSLQMNQMFNQMMFDQTQRDLDRAMQGAGMGMNLGMMQDQMVQNRMNPLMQFGMWEQGRQDNFANMAYQDFINSRLGFLPYLLQAAGGVGAPNSGTPVQTVVDPGKAPTIPPELWALLLS